MSTCPNCGFKNKSSSTYCTECGTKLVKGIKIIKKTDVVKKLNVIKNNKIIEKSRIVIQNKIDEQLEMLQEKVFASKEITLHFIMVALLALYVIISSVIAAKVGSIDDTIEPMRLVIGIPLGLLICESLPYSSFLISIKNRKERSHRLAYLEIFLYTLSILALNLYNHLFLDEINNTNIFLNIYLVIVVIASTKIVLNINEYTMDERKKEDK